MAYLSEISLHDTIYNLKDNNALPLSGGTMADGAIISNLSDPVEAQDAATKNYVDNAVPVPVTNGKEWIQSNITRYIYKIHCANGIWVAAGYGLYYSEDGVVWESSNVSNCSAVSLCYANGLWIAGGSGLYYSEDGMTWTQGDITSTNVGNIYYANNVWVVYTNEGLYYSTDGMTWTLSNIITSSHFGSVYYSNGIWVAGTDGSGLYYSEDGMTWTQSNITYNVILSVYYANGLWIAGGSGLYYSEDGMTWTQSNITTVSFNAVYCANGLWVAGGYNGLYYSTDGMTWTLSNIAENQDIWSVYFDNGVWVAAGYGLYYSTDGKVWVQSCDVSEFRDAYYANGIWVACSRGEGLFYSLGYSEEGMRLKTYVDTQLNRTTAVNIADTNYGTAMARGIYAGTEDMEDGVTDLTSGVIYLVYE